MHFKQRAEWCKMRTYLLILKLKRYLYIIVYAIIGKMHNKRTKLKEHHKELIWLLPQLYLISLRFSSSLPNIAWLVLLSFGPHMKCKKIQRTIDSYGVLT